MPDSSMCCQSVQTALYPMESPSHATTPDFSPGATKQHITSSATADMCLSTAGSHRQWWLMTQLWVCAHVLAELKNSAFATYMEPPPILSRKNDMAQSACPCQGTIWKQSAVVDSWSASAGPDSSLKAGICWALKWQLTKGQILLWQHLWNP